MKLKKRVLLTSTNIVSEKIIGSFSVLDLQLAIIVSIISSSCHADGKERQVKNQYRWRHDTTKPIFFIEQHCTVCIAPLSEKIFNSNCFILGGNHLGFTRCRKNFHISPNCIILYRFLFFLVLSENANNFEALCIPMIYSSRTYIDNVLFSYQINIDCVTREEISKNIARPAPNCFDRAQRLIYGLMENDCYPRFLKSEVYQTLLEQQ